RGAGALPRPALGDQPERDRHPLHPHRQRRLRPLQPDGDHASGSAPAGAGARGRRRRAAGAALGTGGRPGGAATAGGGAPGDLHPAGGGASPGPRPRRFRARERLHRRRSGAGGRLLRGPARAGQRGQGGLTVVLPIAAFEIRQRMRRISTYVYFPIFFALGALFVLAAGGAIANAAVDFGTGGKVNINSPWSLSMLMPLMASFAVVITAALAGRATHQDVDSDSTALFFTTPITRMDYLGGRFLGAFGVIVLLSLAIGLGTYLATITPWMPASRLGPQRFVAYAMPYLLVVIPNMLMMAAVFFALAALTRRMLPVYVGAVVALLGYFIGVNLSGDVERRTLAALVDPFGLMAVDSVTHYWSIAEKNTRLVGLEGDFLLNRLLWMGISLAILGWTYFR